jgi:phosphatidylglycerophosphatase A
MTSSPNSSTNPTTAPLKGWLLFHYAVATWFGCGFAPFAPGTFGSLGAIPLVLVLGWLDNTPISIGVLLLLCVGGARSAHVVAQHRHDDDPGLVVVDEVAGVLVAWLFVAHGPLWIQTLAWLLFRLFDITKPGPIATLEHTRPIGVGIMLDDLLAGLLAGALALCVHLGVGAWH